MAYLRRYLILGLSLFATVSLLAQTPPMSEVAIRNVTIVALANPGVNYSGLFLMNGGQPTSLDIKAGVRGKKLALGKEVKEIILTRQGTDPVTGKPAYIPVASASWPEAKSPNAILIIGFSAGSKEIRALALDDGFVAFPIETTRVVNLSGAALLARIGTFQGELRHGTASASIPYPDLSKLPPNSLARYPFAFAVKPPTGDFVKLGSGFWEAAAGRRSLVIVQPPLVAGSAKIRISTVVDYPPPPPTPVTR